MAAKPPAKSFSQRVAHDPALLARALKDPGLRSKLPPKYLSPAQRATRTQNFTDSQPVVPGGTLTGRDLRGQLDAATTLQYGPHAEAKQQQLGKDVGGWWDQFQKEMQQHYTNQAQIGTDANTALTRLVGQVGGTAAPTTGQDPNAAAQAGQAAQIRSGLLASQGAVQQAQGSNATRLAETLANQVTPEQGLSSRAQEQGKLGDLRSKMGAFRAKTAGDIKQREAANVIEQQKTELAGKIAGVNTAATEAKTAQTRADIAFEKAHGYSRPTGPPKKPGAPTGYQAGGPGLNKYGYTYDQWSALSAGDQAKARAGKGAKPGKPPAPKSGPGSLTPAAESKIISQIQKVYQALKTPTTQVKDANGNVQLKRTTPQQKLAELRAQNVDPRVLNVARSLLHNNGVGVGDFGVSNAHDLGIHVSPHWKVIRSKTPKTGSRGDSQAP